MRRAAGSETASPELGTIAKVRILGEGVVLPSAGFVDGPAAPHTCGTVEVEEDAGARPPAMFQDKMAIEQDGFHLGEKTEVPVEVSPARLHHPDGGFCEVVDQPA